MAPHSYNFEIAKEVLSDNDKNRLLCLFLNCDPGTIDWAKATREFGAASVDSMKVMTRSTLKKIETAGGKEGVEASPAKPTTGGRKRKGKEDGDAEAPPKKRGRKLKKEATPTAAAADEVDA